LFSNDSNCSNYSPVLTVQCSNCSNCSLKSSACALYISVIFTQYSTYVRDICWHTSISSFYNLIWNRLFGLHFQCWPFLISIDLFTIIVFSQRKKFKSLNIHYIFCTSLYIWHPFYIFSYLLHFCQCRVCSFIDATIQTIYHFKIFLSASFCSFLLMRKCLISSIGSQMLSKSEENNSHSLWTTRLVSVLSDILWATQRVLKDRRKKCYM
jgi:predicted neutral ceramidase superfamily lipid hydrolase